MVRNARDYGHEQKLAQVTYPENLDAVLSDADFKSNPERWNFLPGSRRWENAKIGEGVYRNIYCDGKARFVWACNRSGGTLTQGVGATFKSWTGTVVSGTTSTVYSTVAAFVEDENEHDVLRITDDAGGAGAAPEGEWGKVLRAKLNTDEDHITFTVQTAATDQLLTAAPAVGDTFAIRSRCNVIPMTADVEVQDFAGVVVRRDGIADNYWGWFCLEADMVGAMIKAATALTAGLGIVAADDADGATVALSRFINSSAGDLVKGVILGKAIFAGSADLVSDFVPVSLGTVGVDEA